MTTLSGRDRTALVVIDVQNGVVVDAVDRDGVVGRIAGLLDRARDAGTPVIWVQHQDEDLEPSTPDWEYVPELVRREDEPLIAKSYGDSFEATELESVLSQLGVGSLVVTGAQTDFCIRSTLHGALARGYDALLVGDAHTTGEIGLEAGPTPAQVIAHTNRYWRYQAAPGRTGGVIDAADVQF